MGILIGAQICVCLMLAGQAKCSLLKPCALDGTKEMLFLARRMPSLLLEKHSPRHAKPLRSTWKPFLASLNDIPADPSKPLTAAPVWVRLSHLQIYQIGQRRGITVFTLHRSILFNPQDDAFSHELKIALPAPQ